MIITESNNQVSKELLDHAAALSLANTICCAFLLNTQTRTITSDHFFTIWEDYIVDNGNVINFDTILDDGTEDQITLIPNKNSDVIDFFQEKISYGEEHSMLVNNTLGYVNDSSKIQNILDLITNNGDLNRICIEVEKNSNNYVVLLHLQNSYGVREYTFTPVYEHIPKTYGIGKKELDTDYGYNVHRDVILTIFNIDIGTDNTIYYSTANNNNNPTVDTIEVATRNLYGDVCRRINDIFDGSHTYATNDFRYELLCRLLKTCYGLETTNLNTCLFIKGDVYTDFDFESLVNSISNCKLVARCPEHTNPAIKLMDGDNDEIFKLRFKKETYDSNKTGHRYKIYLMPNKITKYFN